MNKSQEFERFVAEHFNKQGYLITTAPAGEDNAVDMFAEKSEHKIAIQVKMHGGSTVKVNRKCIMELYGAKDFYDCGKAILATNVDVRSDAIEVARKLNIEILRLDFGYKKSGMVVDSNSFEAIWEKYVFKLKAAELGMTTGNVIVIIDVDWVGVKKLSSDGTAGSIDIKVFREVYQVICTDGSITDDYINQNYPGEASCGVILILAQLPFLVLRDKPLRLEYL
jgi:Holliday junction resolvase